MPRYLNIIFTAVLAVYLAVSLSVSLKADRAQRCPAMSIEVETAPGTEGFVSSAEIAAELDNLPSEAPGLPAGSIDTQKIRRRLLGLDKLEDASVVTLTDGSVCISVKPIVPVARIFDGDSSYYVNRQGKHVKAGSRFRKNVPVIRGSFVAADTTFTPLSLLPLIDFLAADSVWNSYITMIEARSPRDIYLVPAIREHVVNLGDLSDLPLKMRRLRTFYSKVLSEQGWEKYDTISLKWNGQIVATKRRRRAPEMPVKSYDIDEAVSIDAMLAGDNVAPGQSLEGVAANSDRPIPTRKTAKAG